MRSVVGWSTLAFTCAAGLVSASSARAQWVQQSPTPTGRSLGGAAFASPTHAFVVGQNHHLLETLDAGVTWLPRMSDDLGADPFYTITFPDATHGYLAGNNQDAYRTTDAGQTWTRMTRMQAGSVRVLDFITPTTGFAGYNGALTWTPDGGQTWQLRSGYPDCPIIFGMEFRDASVGLAAGIRSTPHHDEGLYRTVNGGATWALVDPRVQNDVLWIDQQSALAVAGTEVLRSDDEGLTWNAVSSGWITTGLSDLDRAGTTSTLAGVSGKGDIWVSFDLGLSWEHKVIGIGVLPADWSVTFYDATTGMVVGDRGLTYVTQDGGVTWSLSNSGCGDEITDLQFYDDEFGIAVTRFGYVLRTNTHGQRWDVQLLGVTGQVFGRSEGLNAVEIVGPFTAYVGGAGGLLFRTDDAGLTWTSVGFPGGVSGAFEAADFQFIDEAQGWCVGAGQSSSNVYRTYDGGYSWLPVSATGGSYVGVHAAGQVVNIATAGSAVLRSVDEGQSWALTSPPGAVYGFRDMKFANDTVGWLVGDYGYMAKTTNAGATWTHTPRPDTEQLLDLRVLSSTEVWAFGLDSSIPWGYLILHTTDGGATWSRTLTPLPYAETLTEIEARPNGRRWIAGSFGKILYSPGPTLNIALPAGAPRTLPPGSGVTMTIRITPGEDAVDAATATLWYRPGSTGPFRQIPLVPGAGDEFTAPFPSLHCGDRPEYYFSAAGASGTVVTFPPSGAAAALRAEVGAYQSGDLLAENFESGGLPTGWTATGLWHVSGACTPAGARCGTGGHAYLGRDASCTFDTGARVVGTLRTPTIVLPAVNAGETITLTYCSALDTQNCENCLSDFDKAEVWLVRGAVASPCDLPTDRALGELRTVNLTPWAGQSVRLEFRFDSVDALANNFRGWQIDNFSLRGPTLVCTTPACDPDYTADGNVDQDDVACLVATIAGDGSCTSLDPDFNHDGNVDQDDVAALVNVIAGGSCP